MNQSVVSKVVRQETSRRNASNSKSAVCFEAGVGGERRRVRVARDIETHYSDVITTSEPDAREYADKFPELRLPGSGELGEDCGDRFPGSYCTDCWTTNEVGRTCRNPDCPRCHKSWNFHLAKSHVAKIRSVSKTLPGSILQHHGTVSFANLDVRFNSESPIKQAREAAKVYLAKCGVDTGYLYLHLYRIKKEYRGDVLGHESGSGDMGWKDVLPLILERGFESVRDEYLVFEPHFHFIGASDHFLKSATPEIEAETGVVVNRFETERKDGKKKSIDGIEELCKSLAYCLSHTAIRPQSEKQTHRAAAWSFGQVSNFEAFDNDLAEADQAMRKVAPKVLGLEMPDSDCGEPVPKDYTDCSHDPGHTHATPTVAHASLAADGGSTSSRTPTTPTASTAENAMPSLFVSSEVTLTECDGKRAPIWQAESDLGNLAKINRVEARFGEERARKLREAVENWRAMGSPRPPEVDPPDE
jgi:hypothetical protein